MALPQTAIHNRQVRCYVRADREALKQELKVTGWRSLDECDASHAAARITELILEKASEHIPQRNQRTKKSTHPWLTNDLVHLVDAERAAEGTHAYGDAVKVCSARILAEYYKYTSHARQRLLEFRKGSKQW